MAALGIEPNVIFKSDHHGVVEGIVAAGIAVAFVPRLAQPVRRRDVIVKRISPKPPVRPVGIAIRAGDHRSAALTTMIDVLKNVVASREQGERSPAPTQLQRAAADGLSHKVAAPKRSPGEPA
jgi:DNA-binding transcriptional LysR family regulator